MSVLMKLLPILLLLLGLVPLLGADPAAPSAPDLAWSKNGAPTWATPADIAAAKYYRNLAMYIDSRTETEAGVYWKHKALAQVVRAAGVQINSKPSAAEKNQVRLMWNRFEEKGLLVCNNLQFDVANGSILKFAASSLFDPFIYFAADVKIGLTHVDESDGRTILDYLQDKMKSAAGSPLHEKFQAYYDVLRAAGAKHRSELP